MNVQHLHDLRDGKSVRRRRAFNPFVHISIDTPLMQMLFNITRPPQDKPAVKKGIVLATKRKVAPTTPTAGGSMVAYKKERKKY
jgi:hypothetical protein